MNKMKKMSYIKKTAIKNERKLSISIWILKLLVYYGFMTHVLFVCGGVGGVRISAKNLIFSRNNFLIYFLTAP